MNAELPKLRHVAYCSGPAQLAYLLSALQAAGVSPRDCTVFPYTASARNDEVRRTLLLLCGHVCMQTVDTFGLPSSSLHQVLLPFRDPDQAKSTAFWYCKGGIEARLPLNHLMKIAADILFEYYDGFRSPAIVLEQKRRTPPLDSATCIADLRRVATERLLRADRYFMPDDGVWAECAPTEISERTVYVPLELTRSNIQLVGQMLDDIDGGERPREESPGIVLLTGMFSERLTSVSLCDELSVYHDLLGVLRSALTAMPILVKTHPRTSPAKMRGLEDICWKHRADLNTRQQLVEYILKHSGRRDVVVIGPPSTALLSTIQFGYGTAFCLSQQLMASYVGRRYADDYWMTMDHDLMAVAGVSILQSLQQLRDLLTSKETS